MADRYQQLLRRVPTGGGFYLKRSATILPYGTVPYDFLFETTAPNTLFGVFLNGAFRTTVTTDSAGRAVFPLQLDLGQQEIQLVQKGQTTPSISKTVYTKLWAAWYAALAGTFNELDEEITNLRNSLGLETANATYLAEVYAPLVAQSDDVQYLAETFRRSLGELRQAYRLWGARTAGLRQAVHALTGALPFRVPRAWQPSWRVWAPLFDLDWTSQVDPADSESASLNARSVDWVRGTFLDNVNPIVGPFLAPPTPQPLTVTFEAAWAGGDITINGIDDEGNAVSDVFADPGGAATVLGASGVFFADITSVTNDLLGAGAGGATIGLATSRFIRYLASRGPLDPQGLGLGHSIAWDGTSTLTLDLAAPLEVLSSGEFTIGGVVGWEAAQIYLAGKRYAVPVGADFTYVAPYLTVQVDGLALSRAELPASPDDATNIVAAINDAIARDEGYGAGRATGLITIVNFAQIVEGDTIEITDCFGNSATFEADSDLTVVAGNIPFGFGSNVGARNALNARLEFAGIFVRGAYGAGSTLALFSTFGGTAANVAIVATFVNGAAAATATGMVGGTDSPADYSGRAQVLSSAEGDAIGLFAGASSDGVAGSAAIVATPYDASAELCGFAPRTTLSGAEAAGSTALNLTAVPFPPVDLIISDTLPSSTAVAPGPFTLPPWATALEVRFSATYDGGDVQLEWLDSRGDSHIAEVAHPGPNVLDEGAESAVILQTGERSANSPGETAAVTIGTADGADAELEVFNELDPGTPGATWTLEISVNALANQEPIVIIGALTTELVLGTDGVGGVASPAKNVANLLVAVLGTYGLLAAPTGTGADPILTAAAPAAFTGGADDGQSVELTQARSFPLQDFSAQPGQWFRVTSGPFTGEARRIVMVERGASRWPGSGYVALVTGYTTAEPLKLLLESTVGGSFIGESWEILDEVIVQTAVADGAARQLTAAQLLSAGTEGTWQVRVAGARDYGVKLRIGRGLHDSGSDGVVSAPFSSNVSAVFTSATWAPSPGDIGAALEISGGTAYAGSNNGLHTLNTIDPYTMVSGGISGRIQHDYWERGRQFSLAPLSPTDWSDQSNETSLDWVLARRGEVVNVLRFDGLVATIDGDGLFAAYISGAAVELDERLSARRVGLEQGLDQVDVEIDFAMAPTGAASDALDFDGRTTPTGVIAYNLDETAGQLSVWGDTADLRVRLTGDGGTVFGGGAILEARLPSTVTAELLGQQLRIVVLMEQGYAPLGDDWRIDYSFDRGVTFTAETPVAVPLSVWAAGDFGGAAPTYLYSTPVVPPDADGMIVRLRQDNPGVAGQEFIVERFIIGRANDGAFLDQGTVVRSATASAFGEVLWVWSDEALTLAEQRGLGLVEGVEGHIDRITNAHGIWYRFDVTRYSGTDPINLIGVYDDEDWLACTLEGLEVVVGTPAKHSYVQPTRTSLQTQTLAIIAPSNAPLDFPSIHETLPAAGSANEMLAADGIGIPATAWPGTKASASIGAYLGVNGTITLTAVADGSGSNVLSVEVDATLATDRPLAVSYDAATSGFLVELAVRDGALLTNENRAQFVYELFREFTDIVTATLGGTGASALNLAEGPTSFTGGQPTPWRFISGQAVQIASIAAGDAADDAFYVEGTIPQPGSTPYFDAGATHVLTYETMIRAESANIDLGASHADYAWLLDAAIWRRVEPELVAWDQNQVLTFTSGLRATLTIPSNRDQSSAVMYRDDGIRRVALGVNDWFFVDSTNVQLKQAAFARNSIYTLEYVGLTADFPRQSTFKIERKRAAAGAGLAAAPWQEVQIDQVVDGGPTGMRWQKLRVTVYDVRDVRDIRIKTLGFRGIDLYGATPYAPGVIPLDESTP